ncbi:MAG: AmmeMemoRadiSam system protein A [bacterium JZ-2024 1]
MGEEKHLEEEIEGEYLLTIARKSIRLYLEKGEILAVPRDEEIPEPFRAPKATFVSIKKKGELRGCIGTVIPQRRNAVEETIYNAIDAAVSDPRFPALYLEELDECRLSVDVLSPLERVYSKEELDPEKYGVLVIQGGRSAVLLPALPNIHTVEEQLRIVMLKGGFSPELPYEMYRFTVQRWTEKKR